MAFILTAAVAQADPGDTPFWMPDMASVTKIEQTVIMPKGVQKPLEAYGRYYAGITKNGRRMIRGEFVMPQMNDKFPRIYLTQNEDDLPAIEDGGCGVINLYYDIEMQKITAIACNGEA